MLQVPDEVGDVGDYMIRFKPHKRAILEVSLNILVTPAAPAQWQLRCDLPPACVISLSCFLFCVCVLCGDVKPYDETV